MAHHHIAITITQRHRGKRKPNMSDKTIGLNMFTSLNVNKVREEYTKTQGTIGYATYRIEI